MKRLIPFALSLTLFGTLLLSSCAKDDEPEPEGPVSTDPRARFHGHWYISENSTQTGTATYYVDITDSSNASFVQLAYIYGYNTKVRATVNGNTLTIPSQIVEGNNVSGTGTLSSANQINMSYWVNQGSAIDTVTAVLTK